MKRTGAALDQRDADVPLWVPVSLVGRMLGKTRQSAGRWLEAWRIAIRQHGGPGTMREVAVGELLAVVGEDDPHAMDALMQRLVDRRRR